MLLFGCCSASFQYILSVHFGCPEPSVNTDQQTPTNKHRPTNTDQQTLPNPEMCLEQFVTLSSLHIIAVGDIEKNRESFVNRAKWKLLQATGEERGVGVTFLALSCSVELRNYIALYSVCIFMIYLMTSSATQNINKVS